MLDGFLLSAAARTQSVTGQSSCEAEYIAATAATSEAKYIQAPFLSCGQHVNIHLCSDSTGAIGVASRIGPQRLRHLDVRFRWLQAETAAKRVRTWLTNTKLADRSSLMGLTQIPQQLF